ncbi:MAG: SDR family oxidoreductase, partial [Anaerolineales bacterium]|nr:SDR family oxidoreductase [Anaerolineales bacterium]
DQIAVVTGGTGVLCSVISHALVAAGAKVAVLGRNAEPAKALAAELGERAIGLGCDVLERTSLESAAQTILQAFGHVDILINGAGGNHPQATTSSDQLFFDLPVEALRRVFDLNLTGTMLACQVFGRLMAEQKRGVILNIASMNAFRPLTRIPAYSAAKAAVVNFTQWLAVHMAQEYSPAIRVNALAPGFFLTNQNRYLLVDPETGDLTHRGQQILAHTPMGRFGVPEDLVGAALFLVSPASAFVTGVVLPVDGGFSAFSGV